MEPIIKGLHHITAITGNANTTLDFYTRVLGLRLVKRTIKFDDPQTYHFYFGNKIGEPGTLLTFFPWKGISNGKLGTGQVTEIAFSISSKGLDFWMDRFENERIPYSKPMQRFGYEYLIFKDPDGLQLEMVANDHDQRRAYTSLVNEQDAIKGIFNVTLSLRDYSKTAAILTNIFGYKKTDTYKNRFRYETGGIETTSVIDLIHMPTERRGYIARGSVHHLAFRVDSIDTLEEFREKLIKFKFESTPVIDRNYFKSIYFREPGGVFFEIATDPPGFTIDEDLENLGSSLKLPERYEDKRQEIQRTLPIIHSY